MIFNKDAARVNFVLNRNQSALNKQMFDVLFEKRAEIEARFGAELSWRRMDDKKVSIIEFCARLDGRNRDRWPVMTAWLAQHVQQLEKALDPCIGFLRDTIRHPAVHQNDAA